MSADEIRARTQGVLGSVLQHRIDLDAVDLRQVIEGTASVLC